MTERDVVKARGALLNVGDPVILARGNHPIEESMLAPEAIWAMNRLRAFGYLAYLVGGGVRDLLLGVPPKDFDLATNARPSEVDSLFFNCRIIGRRFRIAHIYFRDGQLLEITTFRGLPSEKSAKHSRLVVEDNDFGSPAEDAWRRDLTVNGLFYDSDTGAVIDHVGGLPDLRDRIVRTIGPARERFREDPVRMIRAIRHAARHQFSLAAETWEAISACASDIKLCSTARVLEETLRELRAPDIALSLRLAVDSGLMKGWMPSLWRWLKAPPAPAGNIPYKRFGPWVQPSWGQPEAFWSQLLVVGERIRAGEAISDWVLLASFVLARCWSHIHARCQTGTATRRLWCETLDGPIHAFFRDLALSGRDAERVRNILQTYWRLHLYPVQGGLAGGLRRSPHLPEATQLFGFELAAQGVKVPDWLESFKS